MNVWSDERSFWRVLIEKLVMKQLQENDSRLKIDVGLHAGDDRAEDPNVKYFVLVLKNSRYSKC